ncbi:hypothetical protein KP509_37G017800 [Ceratopteris richardii]|nr:hypothetical protein KP509_37G017800 [Ceratopteris richardii]
MNPYPTDYIKELSDNDESNSVYVVKKFSMGLAANSNIVTRFFSSKAGYIWVVFFFEIALASIGTLTKLAPFSIFADIVNFGSMAVVLEQDITTMVRSRIANISVSQGLSALPFAIGVGIYAFEGIALVLPLESSMKERKNFGKVLGVAMLCITLLYISFGLMGYFAFGEDTLDIVTLNLGSGWKPTLVKVGLCLGLFFTFAVMMFPVHQLVEQRLLRGRQSILLRAVIVFIAALCAIGIPHFGDFLSLIGNSVCCAVAFIVPALCHIKANRKEISKVALGIDYVIIVLGAVYGVWGTVLAVQNICSSV